MEGNAMFGEAQDWNLLWAQPRTQCDVYAICGAFGRCIIQNTLPLCECMLGFELRSLNDWNLSDWSRGCMRRTHLNCGNNTSVDAEKDKFLLMLNMRLPEMPQSQLMKMLEVMIYISNLRLPSFRVLEEIRGS